MAERIMPVVVIARCDIFATIPLCIVWEGREYPIERVLDRRRDVLRKTGAIAIRYTVRMRKQQRILCRTAKTAGISSRPTRSRRRTRCIAALI